MEFTSALFVARWLKNKIGRVPTKKEIKTIIEYTGQDSMTAQECEDTFHDLQGIWVMCSCCGKWILSDDIWQDDDWGHVFCCDDCVNEFDGDYY